MKINEIIIEKWSEKYKRSINCKNPKGFSQRAHCQGLKKGVSEGSETITLQKPFHKKVVVDDIELIARSSGNNDLNITAFSASEPGDTPIAQAKFWKEGSHLFSEKTFVSQIHQRKGIATLMYQFVKSLGFDIRPSKEKTELGQTLWRGFASKDSLSKKSIAQKFKPGVREGVAEGKSIGYKEIEFVCVNPKYPDATDPKLQKQMYLGLKKIPNVIPLLQDWDEYSEGQKSLSAIYKDRESKQKILALAKQLGVEIDLERSVSDKYVDRTIRGEHEGQSK